MSKFNPHPKRFYKPLFSDEQRREIEGVRSRLEAYRNKVQPCPALPGEREDIVQSEPEWTSRQWDMVQQLRSEVTGWRKNHAEMMLAVDKITTKTGAKSPDPF